MSVFQKTKEQTDQKVMVQLMSKLADNPTISQRELSSELNIALGLMNTYLKRSIKKGLVRAAQVAPKRWAYFVTPKGIKEKSHMVVDYLSNSLTFFRDARAQCEEVFTECIAKGWTKIAIVGEGDLAEISRLVSNGIEINVTIMPAPTPIKLDKSGKAENLVHLDKLGFKAFDAVLITDIQNPQGTYDLLKKAIKPYRLLTLELLHIS